MPKVLLVDDDKDLVEMIIDDLVAERYTVEVANSGRDAIDFLQVTDYDLILMDWNLPDMTGVQIIKVIRNQGKATPIIMLTGRSAIENKEEGMDSGADDYLTKPFNIRELLVRMRAALRRSAGKLTHSLHIKDIELDPVKYSVTKAGRDIHLSKIDFALLEFFMRNPGHVFGIQTILSRVWNLESDASPEGLRAAIRRIRKAVDDDDNLENSIIENIPRVGYKLRT